MTTNEKVLEALGALGFKPKLVEDTLYSFDYEGQEYWYLLNEIRNALIIAIPNIYELDEENPMACLELEERLNATLLFVKVSRESGYLWLYYERELMGEEDLRPVVALMIARLESALYATEKIIATVNYFEAVLADEEKNNNDNTDNDKEE